MDKMKSYNLNKLRKISSKKILFKRASSELVSTKLIVIILVVLVLLAVAFFLIKGDILDWIKQLPSFGSANDTEVEVTPDVGVVSNGVEVGSIGKFSKGEQYIRARYADKTSEDTFFYWDGNEYSAKIMYKSNLFWGYETISRDIQVGSYNAKTGMVINPIYLDFNSDIYKKSLVSGNSFNVKALSRINGSSMKGNTLYKNKDVPDAEIKNEELINDYKKSEKVIVNINTITKDANGVVTIDLKTYLDYGPKVSKLLLKKDGNVINIVIPGDNWYNQDKTLGRIMSDDFIWFKGVGGFGMTQISESGIFIPSTISFHGFDRSTLRIDYDKVNAFFPKK